MLQWWRGASLRTHLLVRLAGLFCVMAGIFFFASLQAVNASTQQALEEREVVAQLMAERIDAQLGHALAMLQSAVADEDQNLTEGDLTPIESQLQGLFEHSILFKRILLLDATGVVRWTEPPPSHDGPSWLYPQHPARGVYTGLSTNHGLSGPEAGSGDVPRHSRGGIMGYVCGWIDLGDPRASSYVPYPAAKAIPIW